MLYTARITLPASLFQSDIEKLSDALGELAQSHSALREGRTESGDWALEWVLLEEPSAEDLSVRTGHMISAYGLDISIAPADWQIAPLADQNWLEYSHQQLPAFSVGPFFIYGSHHEGGAPDGKMGLQIDAVTAFGSGEHGTTKGCLLAMLDLKGIGVCPWNILDMGTGSGILAIAAWKLWKTPILAVDIDEESVRVTQRHLAGNKIPTGAGNVQCAQSDGFGGDLVQKKKPYELVIANILPGPLKAMAADLYATVDSNGYVILSGILQEQAADVLNVYEPLGLMLKKRYDIDEWSTLVLQRL